MRKKANVLKVVMLFGAVLVNSTALATEYSRDVTVLKLHPISASRPNGPSTQNLILIYVNPAVWGSSNCRTDAADLRVEDWHLQSILLTAWKASMPIKIYVDDTLRPDTSDTLCQVTALLVG